MSRELLYIIHPLVGDGSAEWGDRTRNINRYLRICAYAQAGDRSVLSWIHNVLLHQHFPPPSGTEHDYYMGIDLPLLRKADVVWKCCPDGVSRGGDTEHEEALKCGIPVVQERWMVDPLLPDTAHFSLHPKYDLIHHLTRQRAFSARAFGPGRREQGIIEHMAKELDEIRKDPHDLYERIDMALLAFDGAWRQGYWPDEIADAFHEKLVLNEGRPWPDWRERSESEAIEHVRDDDE